MDWVGDITWLTRIYPSSPLQPGPVHSGGGVSREADVLYMYRYIYTHTAWSFYLPQTSHEQHRRWLQRPLLTKNRNWTSRSQMEPPKKHICNMARGRKMDIKRDISWFYEVFKGRKTKLPSIWIRTPIEEESSSTQDAAAAAASCCFAVTPSGQWSTLLLQVTHING